MNINFYSHTEAKVSPGTEASYLSDYVLMADSVYCDSNIATAMLMYLETDQHSDEMIIALFANAHKGNEKAFALATKYLENIQQINKLKKIKHKDRNALILLGKFKTAVNFFRDEVKNRYREINVKYDIQELLPFAENKILNLKFAEYMHPDNKENNFVTDIANDIINRDVTLSLTDSVDEMLTFDTLTSSNQEDCNFIKIPLWKFPPIVATPFEHLNYIRENLKPVLQPFKDKLKELQTEFFTLEFIPENLPHFKQTITSKITPLIQPVQNTIDESIYLSKLKNKYPENFGMVFCIGIAPAETIVNYYQQNEIIKPFEANEIKSRISRHISLRSTHIFTYFEVHNQTSVNNESI